MHWRRSLCQEWFPEKRRRSIRQHSPSFADPAEAETEVRKARELLAVEEGDPPTAIRDRLRHTMWENVGVFRTEDSLTEALGEILNCHPGRLL